MFVSLCQKCSVIGHVFSVLPPAILPCCTHYNFQYKDIKYSYLQIYVSYQMQGIKIYFILKQYNVLNQDLKCIILLHHVPS